MHAHAKIKGIKSVLFAAKPHVRQTKGTVNEFKSNMLRAKSLNSSKSNRPTVMAKVANKKASGKISATTTITPSRARAPSSSTITPWWRRCIAPSSHLCPISTVKTLWLKHNHNPAVADSENLAIIHQQFSTKQNLELLKISE